MINDIKINTMYYTKQTSSISILPDVPFPKYDDLEMYPGQLKMVEQKMKDEPLQP